MAARAARTLGEVLPVVAKVGHEPHHLAVPLVVVVLVAQTRLDLLRHGVDHLRHGHAAVLDLEAEEHVGRIRPRGDAHVELRAVGAHDAGQDELPDAGERAAFRSGAR